MESMTWTLTEAGMTGLHRLGLGALYRTCLDMERQKKLTPDQWSHTKTSLTLKGKTPKAILDLLSVIYDYAFQIREGVIYLPGAYGRNPVPKEVLVALQKGLLSTILRSNQSHGPLDKTQSIDYDCEGHSLTANYSGMTYFSSHKSQFLSKLWDARRKGFKTSVACPSTMAPGYKKRHVKVSGTDVLQPAHMIVLIQFALAGVITLSYSRKDENSGKYQNYAVLCYPEVQDLYLYDRHRPIMTPTTAKECVVKGGIDVALLVQLKILEKFQQKTEVERVFVMEYTSVAWDQQQPSRCSVTQFDLASMDDESIKMIQSAVSALAPQLRKSSKEEESYFLGDNNVRPFVLQNLVSGRKWYHDFGKFVDCMKMFMHVRYNRKGIGQMIEKMPMESDKALITALHFAMRARFAEIYNDSAANAQEKKKKTREQWFYNLSRARRMDEVRSIICEMIARAMPNRAMSAVWEQVIPMFRNPNNWSYLRDLALVAISTDPPVKKYQCASCENTGWWSDFKSDTGHKCEACGSTERPKPIEAKTEETEDEEEESLELVEG